MNTQKGFSIIELMIAIALSVTLLYGVGQIFLANKQSINKANAYAHVQESGRFATELMIKDIRMADFWGCAPDTSVILDHLDTTDVDYEPSMSYTGTNGIAGQDDVAASTTISTITVREGTDTLTLKGANPLGAKVIPPYMNIAAATIQLNANNDIPLGKIIMITDCSKGDLFSNTATNTISGDTLIHSTDTISCVGCVNNAIKNLSQTYTASAQIVEPYTKVYFIGQNPQGGWSLYRSFNGVASEFVRDVSDLQLFYGEDTGADNSADVFVDASAVTDMDKAVSIRSVVTVNSISGLDVSLSRDYSITANIRNRTL